MGAIDVGDGSTANALIDLSYEPRYNEMILEDNYIPVVNLEIQLNKTAILQIR